MMHPEALDIRGLGNKRENLIYGDELIFRSSSWGNYCTVWGLEW